MMVVFKNIHVHWALVAIICFSSVSEALKAGRKNGNVLSGAYLVEFESIFSPVDEEQFYSELGARKINTSPRVKLSHELFKGASFNLLGSHDNDSTIETIKSLAMIKQLWPIRLHSLPAKIKPVKAPKITPASFQKRTALIDTYIPHIMGNVDKLRNEGYAGEGLSIAIVDTGVDYTHPVLGGGIGPGFKISYGYDLVGDEYNGTNNPIPGDDPMDCQGHGTHVSGIIGADPDNPYSFTGVVPNATIRMYKVFGCNGTVSDDVLISAFNMAFEAGVDVISASIGSSLGWVEDPWEVAVSRIVAAGTPCIIAAGNDGANGAFDSSSAGEAIGATSVGSVDSLDEPVLLTPAIYKTPNDTEGIEFGYEAGAELGDFGNVTFPLYATSLNDSVPDDACTGTPYPNLTNFVVLIRRGICSFDQKIATVAPFGAQRILFYNDVAGEPVSAGDTSPTIPVGMVSSALGASWISLLSAGIPVTIEFTAEAEAGFDYEDPSNDITGGFMSTFSSWSPTYELYVKPEVSAPGGNILSTWPVSKGSYAVLSGTSMATPFITGCVALIKQVRGKKTSPLEIQNLLATTAQPLDFNDGTTDSFTGVLAPVIQQGGGLVDVYAAAKSETILSVSKLAFNDSAHFVKRTPFVIKNNGQIPVTYSIGNLPAGLILALEPDSIYPSPFPPGMTDGPATIKFTPDSVTLLPGDEAEIMAELTPPSGFDVTRIPIYSGFISVNGSNGDYFTLPYAGVAASLYDVKLTDTPDGFPVLTNSSDSTGTPIESATANSTIPYFTIPHSNSSSSSNTTAYPAISWALAMGSRIVRIDVIPAPNNTSRVKEILGVKSLGPIPGYPTLDNARDVLIETVWNGQLADGTFVPSGAYSLLYRALKIFGDEDNGADYEAFETGIFGINYLPGMSIYQ